MLLLFFSKGDVLLPGTRRRDGEQCFGERSKGSLVSSSLIVGPQTQMIAVSVTYLLLN